jgi:signal transduction histidine kinase
MGAAQEANANMASTSDARDTQLESGAPRQTKTPGGSGGVSTKKRKGRALVVEAENGSGATLAAVLRHDGYTVQVASAGADIAKALRAQPVDVVLAELSADDPHGEGLLAQVRALAPGAATIILTSYATLDAALRALRAGAYDYLAKPVDVDELRSTLRRAMDHKRLERELAARVRELETAQAQLRDLNAHLQQRVEEATAALQRQVEALDEANQRLVQAQEQHHRFIAMVAHEMRGPLGPIINYAQMATRPAVTPEKRGEYMKIIVEHAMRMNRLVDDLQTATRLSTGKFTLRPQSCDVAAAVEGLVEQFSSSDHDRRFSLERPPEPVTAEVDADRVLQAVRNLVENAIKYSVEGGAIELAVWRDVERVYIRVGDYGAGIPEAERERIFQPFTRLERRSNDHAGTGLGLYIVRGIVAEHGGDLSVYNRVEGERAHGALFTLALPLRAPDPPDAPAAL